MRVAQAAATLRGASKVDVSWGWRFRKQRFRSIHQTSFSCLNSVAIATLLLLMLNHNVGAEQFDGPTFRQGLWHFERTLERLPKLSDERSLLMRREMTRCVDPTIAMKATFASPDVGHCRSMKPDLHGRQYVFPMRCDLMGPVKTTITVENDGAYTEINELSVGPFPRMDTVIAHRIGDCH